MATKKTLSKKSTPIKKATKASSAKKTISKKKVVSKAKTTRKAAAPKKSVKKVVAKKKTLAPKKTVKKVVAKKAAPKKAAKKVVQPLEDRLAKEALQFLNDASKILRAGIKTANKTTSKARTSTHKKAHTLLGKATRHLDKVLSESTSIVRKAIKKI